MSSDSQQTVHSSNQPYQELLIDPNFLNFVEHVVCTKVSSVEQGYREELGNSEKVWSERKTQLKDQMQLLTDQLARAMVAQARYDI
jgi:hypothetical protein